VYLDRRERLNVRGVVSEHMVLDLVRVEESELAVRALVEMLLVTHASYLHGAAGTR